MRLIYLYGYSHRVRCLSTNSSSRSFEYRSKGWGKWAMARTFQRQCDLKLSWHSTSKPSPSKNRETKIIWTSSVRTYWLPWRIRIGKLSLTILGTKSHGGLTIMRSEPRLYKIFDYFVKSYKGNKVGTQKGGKMRRISAKNRESKQF